jgi:aryl-alcohol dehydrogenase-like predicted oxidoreductase
MTSDAVTAAAAGTWTLGDLTVNRMGFGAMRLPQTGRALAADAVPGDRGRAITVLRRAVELGVNHIDTAAFYFSALRSANELINTALAPYPDDLRVAGLIRHLGVSGVTPGQLAEALAIAPVVCVQNRYGIGASPAEHEFVDACGDQGIAFVPFFTIAGRGGGRGVTGDEHEEVLAIASAHGATAAQVRLAWTLQRGAHVLAIPGTGDPAHLAANVAASALRLSGEELALLESVTIPA